VEVGSVFRSIPGKGEVNWLHRVMMDSYTESFISYAKLLGNPLVYDSDDLIFSEDAATYLSNIGNKRYQQKYKGYLEAMLACDAVTVSTTYLANKVKEFHPNVYLLRNALSCSYLEQARKVAEYKKSNISSFVTVAYLYGSTSFNQNFKIIEQTLLTLLKEFQGCKLLLVGNIEFSDKFYDFGIRFEHRDFMPYEKYASLFEEIDINLVPLEVNEAVCQSKSELKYMEAGACGVPIIVSPTGTFSEVIENGVNGLLANDAQWYDQIKSLIIDPVKRDAIGAAARNHVISNYSPEVRRLELEAIMQDICLGKKEKIEAGVCKKIGFRIKLEMLRIFKICRIWLTTTQKRIIRKFK